MKGRIHSMDTFGTVDGPGIRFVLFMQGCALQCQFCHNPDSWDTAQGRQMSVDEVIAELEPYLVYYRKSGGGITVTGGEPTLQASFVAELFKTVKERFGLHTALDSSGFCEPANAESLIAHTDLVLLDLKQMDSARHQQLTSQPNERILKFASWLAELKKPMWIRHVLIPGITDAWQDLTALGRFVSGLDSVERIELLPYHRMGVYKWQQLGRSYPLEGIQTPSAAELERAKIIIETARKKSAASP
ncbi:pyruvate formate-lyase-activating protein [Paenibacillus sp. GCM10012307]|uniref:Pyruvate formate-lyase-activating enzyme n=1 Tax=Paenibacillus roseus TaxID=2798579 RepID=A0A934MRE6_9BACL|nr:pyruvate formate-lyase-activating protein [Paenibacillus roseus]MBJ6362274.1 pyruvate formate lyase-activating protein [Paenibacillus roseus]